MSIPRDLWVPIPGKSFSQRINTTFDTGPDLLVQTIKQDLGIGIDHYVEVDFQSFRDIVNAVGGVKEYFPTPARDAYSLLNIPAAGCYTMTGDMALSFVRARHYEYKVNGRWVSEAESDLARIKRQQSFIKKMMAKAQSSGMTNPLELNSIIGGVTKNLTLDSGFSQGLLLTLGKRFRGLSPDSLPTATLPTTQANDRAAPTCCCLQQPQATQAIADFLSTGHAAPHHDRQHVGHHFQRGCRAACKWQCSTAPGAPARRPRRAPTSPSRASSSPVPTRPTTSATPRR